MRLTASVSTYIDCIAQEDLTCVEANDIDSHIESGQENFLPTKLEQAKVRYNFVIAVHSKFQVQTKEDEKGIPECTWQILNTPCARC